MSSSIIVIGGLNTDIVTQGVDRLVGPGELTFGKNVKILPGGKSRNLAQMIAMLTEPDTVAMVGRTSRDPFNLWRVPYQALVETGVNVEYVKVLDFHEVGKFPGVALIPVDRDGRNQIYVMPGANEDFGPEDIDGADALFRDAAERNGMLALSLEMPLETAKYAVRKANEYGLKVILDPGGIRDTMSSSEYDSTMELLSMGIHLIKPNEHEMKILTRVDIVDFASAELATHLFRKIGIANTVITAGSKGAYLFTPSIRKHIPVPNIDIPNCVCDETGCGDQSMAIICALLHKGLPLESAVEKGVLAGTLQFCRSGVVPLTMPEIEKAARQVHA